MVAPVFVRCFRQVTGGGTKEFNAILANPVITHTGPLSLSFPVKILQPTWHDALEHTRVGGCVKRMVLVWGAQGQEGTPGN